MKRFWEIVGFKPSDLLHFGGHTDFYFFWIYLRGKYHRNPMSLYAIVFPKHIIDSNKLEFLRLAAVFLLNFPFYSVNKRFVKTKGSSAGIPSPLFIPASAGSFVKK